MSTNFSFLETTIDDVHKAFITKTLTSSRLVDWYLNRIEKFDKSGPSLQAIVSINQKAREEAFLLDMHLEKTGSLKGPLHGIPILVKDQAETVGIPTTFGNKEFSSYLPKENATVIDKLLGAGAIILAKTSMCDFAAGWFSFSSVTGHTKNPYSLRRDAGGSSAGTGAGIAANFGLVGIGEDTGGSLRIPSSFNNLFGLRTTTGLVSRKGFSPLIHFQDVPGPMTRTVRDAAKLLDVIVGYDCQDSFTSVNVQANNVGTYESQLEGASLVGVKIGVLREAFGPDDYYSSPVNQVINSTLKLLREMGAEFVDVEIPNLKELLTETSLYTHQSKSDITTFLGSRPNAAFDSFMELYESKSFHPLNDLYHEIAKGPETPEKIDNYYRKRFSQETLRREILNVFGFHNIDAMLYPNVRVLPPTYEDLESNKWSSLDFPTNTTITSQSGLPSMSIPAGFTNDGVPVGIELVGELFSEVKLLRYAYAYEKIAKPRQIPKGLELDSYSDLESSTNNGTKEKVFFNESN